MNRKKIDELVDGNFEVYGDIDEVIDNLSKLRKLYKEAGYLSLEIRCINEERIVVMGTRIENDKEFAKRKKEFAKERKKKEPLKLIKK